MSIINKQVQLGKDLFEINNKTVRKMIEMQISGIKQYVETNQNFVRRLPEIKDAQTFFKLGGEYNKTVWDAFQADLRERADVVKEAFSDSGVAVRTAYSSEVSAEGEEQAA